MYVNWDYWGLNAKVTFDGVAKQIIVNPEVTMLDIRADVYSAWVEWLALGNSNFLYAMRYTGLDVIPGGFSGDSYFLVNGWKLIVDMTKVRISGVLFSDDYETAYFDAGLNAIYPASVSALVNTVTMTRNVITGDLSSLVIPTPPSAVENASAVWNAPPAEMQVGGIGNWLYKKVLTLPKFIGLK